MRVMINVFFSGPNRESNLKVSEKKINKESNPVAKDGVTKAKVSAYTLKAFETYLQENSKQLEGVKLKFKGTLSNEQQKGVLKAIDTLPKGTLTEVAFKKVHPVKEKQSCKFPFDVEVHKQFVAELKKRIKV